MRDLWTTDTGLDDRRMRTVQTALIYQGGKEVPVFRRLSLWQWLQWQVITRIYGWSETHYLRLMHECNGWGFDEQERFE